MLRACAAFFVTTMAPLCLAACSDGAATTSTNPTTTSADPNAAARASTVAGTTSLPARLETSDPTTSVPTTSDPVTAALIADRPVDVIVPDGLGANPASLVVVLHGYTGTADTQQLYFRFQDEAAARGAILAYPDGTVDARGAQFWNATDSCCNFFGSTVDDVAYLAAVVDHVRSIHPVDPDRIYLAGHSNGGFMAYRLACERADLFAAVVSLAGATAADPEDCTPSEAVSIAQVHGTLDEVIAYDGGELLGNAHPSAAATASTWASYNGCSTAISADGDQLDVEREIAGAETTVARFSGCATAGAVELWTIDTGRHIPALSDNFATAVFDFFEAHPKSGSG